MSTTAGPIHRLAAWKALTDVITPSARRGLRYADRVPGGLFPSSDLSYLAFRLGMGARPSATHVELNRLMTAGTPVSVWSALLDGVLSFDVRDRLRDIAIPTTVFVGTRDLLTPPSAAKAMYSGLSHKRGLEVFPGAGHMLMLERREDVSDRLRAFSKELQHSEEREVGR
jgi:pimeloyl-ACP methyl ester carboxylesterase